jgi:NADPH-dependent 2,4-dienoyl-CoA reductase/sulfur reductase-like enzyme
MSEHHLIIGGNAAGMTAASRARRLDPSLTITIFEASRHISYSICGLPYCVGGHLPHFEDLVLFTPETLLNERRIEARIRTRAVEILPSRRSVVVEGPGGRERETLKYDKLLIATGYRPIEPQVEGVEARGVFTASRIEDGEAISEWLGSGVRRQAVIIGGGYVGLEMAEALRCRGLEVTVVEKSPSVFQALDEEMAVLLQAEMESKGVSVLTGRSAGRIHTRGDDTVESVELEGSRRLLPADVVFLDVGVEPRVDLAESAGVRLGPSGAIQVSERMETNIPGIYAAGNCAEAVHGVTGRPVVAPMGTVAVKQGRVAGENMAGRVARFQGTLGTAALKVFDINAARTGLSSREASREGFHIVEAKIEARFQAPYFEGSEPGTVKVVADADSGRLLGAQIVGNEMAVLRIDILATALQSKMTVDEASQLDLAYTPALGALWNPVLIAMNVLMKQLK